MEGEMILDLQFSLVCHVWLYLHPTVRPHLDRQVLVHLAGILEGHRQQTPHHAPVLNLAQYIRETVI